MSHVWKEFRFCNRGAVLIEAAFVFPVLLLFLFGIISCGSYLGLCHAVQQAANEGARASLAGLSADERSSIATDVANSAIASSLVGSAKAVNVVSIDNGQTLTVTVDYDASANPLIGLLAMGRISSMIERRASVRLGGS